VLKTELNARKRNAETKTTTKMQKQNEKTLHYFDKPAKLNDDGKVTEKARKAKVGMLFMVIPDKVTEMLLKAANVEIPIRWGIYKGFEIKETETQIYQIAILEACEEPYTDPIEDVIGNFHKDLHKLRCIANKVFTADRCRFLEDS